MGNSANKELQRQVEIFNKNGVTNKTGQRTKNFKQLSVKDLLKLQQQILLEYPFLSTVWESMLVTDMATEDNVIVYANDQFERMTLYPKEEIIGRNCRFLQGELTDRDTVSKIRNAVEKGLKLDVQLLNYRKDGVPFWNNFMMLPIHKKGKKAGQVTHFIAIQKDVTLLKEVGEGDPKNWSAPEVCMWLEHHGLGGHHLQIISKKIDGKKLLELSKEDLPMLGFELAAERKKLLKLIRSLEDDEDDAWEEPRKKAKVSKELKEKFKKVVPAENSGKEGDDVAADAGKEIWKEKKPDAKGVKDYLLAVKCFLEGFKEPVVFLVPSDVTFDQLKNQIESKFGCDVSMMHKDEDEISVENDEDLKSVLLLTEGGTLPLHLEREKTKMKASTTRYINSLPTPHVITDAGNYVLFANLAAKQLLGNYLRKDLSELVSGLQKSGPTGPEGVKVTLNTSNSSKKGKKKDDSVSANLVITQTYKSRLIWSFETK